jgi:hypothetical protein
VKTTTPSLKSFQPSLAAALAIVIVLGLSVRPAQAYTVTLQEVGTDVVATGSGPINLTGLTPFVNSQDTNPAILALLGLIDTGAFASIVDVYQGFTGPATFGSGGAFSPNTASGDFVGIAGFFGLLSVPENYVSNTALSNSMTFNNATFASLGLTPGTYVWTWGTGLENQNFTLRIGVGVPDGGSTVALLGFALLGLTALRRKLFAHWNPWLRHSPNSNQLC